MCSNIKQFNEKSYFEDFKFNKGDLMVKIPKSRGGSSDHTIRRMRILIEKMVEIKFGESLVCENIGKMFPPKKEFVSEKQTNLISSLSKILELIPNEFKKNLFAHLISYNFERSFLESQGFKSSSKLWTTAKKLYTNQSDPSTPLNLPLFSKEKKQRVSTCKESVIKFLQIPGICQPSAHEMTTMKRRTNTTPEVIENTMNFYTNKSDLFHLYNRTRTNTTELNLKGMCFSTFNQHIPKNYKQAKCKTDMCDVCVAHDNLLKKKKVSELNEEDKLFKQFYIHHRNVVESRRKSFNEQLQKLEDGTIIFVCDFKTNINLNQSMTQVSRQYYSACSRGFLAFVAYYFDKESKSVRKFIFNFLTNDLSKDCRLVDQYFNELLESCQFKEIASKCCAENAMPNISLWADNAPTFRTYNMLGLLYETSSKFNCKIQFNLFGERHGKSDCDRWFAVVANAHRKYIQKPNSNIHRDEDTFVANLKSSTQIEHHTFVKLHGQHDNNNKQVEIDTYTTDSFKIRQVYSFGFSSGECYYVPTPNLLDGTNTKYVAEYVSQKSTGKDHKIGHQTPTADNNFTTDSCPGESELNENGYPKFIRKLANKRTTISSYLYEKMKPTTEMLEPVHHNAAEENDTCYHHEDDIPARETKKGRTTRSKSQPAESKYQNRKGFDHSVSNANELVTMIKQYTSSRHNYGIIKYDRSNFIFRHDINFNKKELYINNITLDTNANPSEDAMPSVEANADAFKVRLQDEFKAEYVIKYAKFSVADPVSMSSAIQEIKSTFDASPPKRRTFTSAIEDILLP